MGLSLIGQETMGKSNAPILKGAGFSSAWLSGPSVRFWPMGHGMDGHQETIQFHSINEMMCI